VSEPSTRSALVFVYASYAARYLYLLILIPFYGRVLGPEAYGKVLAAMSLYGVVWLLTNYGFAVVGTRAVASASDLRSAAAEFGRHVQARLLMCVLGLLVGLGGTLLSPVLRAEPGYGAAATALGLVSAFNLGWYFQGRGRFRTSVLLEVAGFAISLVLILLSVHDSRDGLLVLLSLLASGVTTTLVSYLIALAELERGHIRIRGGISLVRESTAMFTASGIGALTTSASTFVLSLVASVQSVGFFGAADRIANLCIGLMAPANQVLVGTVSRRLSENGHAASAYSLMRSSMIVMTAAGGVVMLMCLILAPWLVPLVMGDAFVPSVVLVQLYGLVLPLTAFNQAARMYVLIPLGRDVAVANISIAGGLITWAAMASFVLPWGGAGLVAAKIFGELATTSLMVGMFLRQPELRRIFQRASADAAPDEPAPETAATVAPAALDLPALQRPRVSVVVCNYNYGRFLEATLRSVVGQTVPCEVIVVDDGSTDDSPGILARWAGRVKVILQPNGGQVAAYNTGFAASRGDVVVFLDSDDLLDPDLAEQLSHAFAPGVVKVHWPMRLIDEAGQPIGGRTPNALATGDVGKAFLRHGFLYASAPGSGNAYRRSALASLFPLPTDAVDRHGADFFTIYGVAVFGEVRALPEIAGSYRLHGRGSDEPAGLVFGNAARSVDELQRFNNRSARLQRWLSACTRGVVVPPARFLDFSIEKVRLARAIFESENYLQGVRRGALAVPTTLRALWLRQDMRAAKKLGLTAWCALVLLAPRRLGFPVARYVCNPASRA